MSETMSETHLYQHGISPLPGNFFMLSGRGKEGGQGEEEGEDEEVFLEDQI